MPKDRSKDSCDFRTPEKGLAWDLHREQMYTYYYLRLAQMKDVSAVPKSKIYAERDALFHMRLGDR